MPAMSHSWRFQISTDRSVDDLVLDGGVAVGVARAEETARNFAVLVGWKRDRVAADRASYQADGMYLVVSHQWR